MENSILRCAALTSSGSEGSQGSAQSPGGGGQEVVEGKEDNMLTVECDANFAAVLGLEFLAVDLDGTGVGVEDAVADHPGLG